MSEPLVVLIHGWPGLPSDYDDVVARLTGVHCVVPALAGLGDAYAGRIEPGAASADAHASRLLAALPEGVPLIAVGYDIGSRIAQAMLRAEPGRFVGAVLTPAYPGIGDRARDREVSAHFWYQHFHRTPVAAPLIDGRADAVRAYLGYLVDAWAADSLTRGQRFEEVVAAYARPGAFEASIAWYGDNVGYMDS